MIRLKHTGENKGIGIVPWNAQQKARFEERLIGRASYALQVIEFLKKQDQLEQELKNKLNTVPTSSLQRLMNDPDVRDVIGVSAENGKIVSSFSPEDIVKPLTKIVKDLLHKDFTVKEIYYKDDRANYIETFKNNELPNKTKPLRSKWELVTNNPPKATENEKEYKQGRIKRSVSLSSRRNTIIPKSCIIHINEPRINKIYRELKDIDLNYYINAAAVMFRVFIELSVDVFVEKKNITNMKLDSSLQKKVQEVANYLQTNNYLDKHKLKGIRTSVSNPNNIMSINTFNAYVHNKHFSPIAGDLKTTWDNIEPFITKIWEIL